MVTRIPGCNAFRAGESLDVACTCPHVAILICNANAIRDDRWTVSLSGRAAGEYNVENELRAMLIMPESANGLTITGYPSPCTIFDTTYAPELDVLGMKKLRMTLAQIKGSGNFGTVQFVCCCIDETTATLGNVAAEFIYTNPSPYEVGTFVDYRFRLRTI
jgi:hypothetical protein